MNDLSSHSVLPSLNYLSGHLSASRFLPFKIPERFNQSNSIQDPPSKLIPKIIDETPCLVGLEEIESEVRSVLVRTVSENEGNVLLLSGPRGSGKTTVISRSLSLLSHPCLYGSNGFITIKLNGFVHTNDKLALKDMARQLLTSLQDQEKKKVIGKILDQDQEDLDSDNQPEQDIPRFTNYGETLKNLLEVLEPQPSFSRDQGPKSKALVIILEEFDLFAELDRQAFLYCLLDAVQGNKRRGGLCIIGTTVVVDCLDRLEKRVKSRCQSRIRYLNCPTTDEERIELLRSVLEIPIGIFSTELFTQQWNEDVERFLKEKKVREWIKNRFDLISEAVVPILQELNTIVSRVAYETQQKGTIQFPALKSSELFERNSLPWWSHQLSTVELSVLIGCKHLSTIHHNGIFNLEMCWDGYRQHLKRIALGHPSDQSGNNESGLKVQSQMYSRDTFEMAWERLTNLEIILPIGIMTGKNHDRTKAKAKQNLMLGGRRYELMKLVPFLSQIDKVVLHERKELALHLKRWCKNWSD